MMTIPHIVLGSIKLSINLNQFQMATEAILNPSTTTSSLSFSARDRLAHNPTLLLKNARVQKTRDLHDDRNEIS